MEFMTTQQLREYDDANMRTSDKQWNIYMTKGKDSIREIQTKDIASMKMNEMVKMSVSEDAFILVQKVTGTVLKDFLKDRKRLRGLYASHKIMMVHRTTHPMFYDMHNYSVYYCEDANENGKQVSLNGHKNIKYGGYFEMFIHNTRYIWEDDSMDHHVYHLIVSRGSNKCDGTVGFIETCKLSGNELAIRRIQRKIVNAIIKSQELEMANRKMDGNIKYVWEMWSIIAIASIGIILLIFIKIEIIYSILHST